MELIKYSRVVNRIFLSKIIIKTQINISYYNIFAIRINLDDVSTEHIVQIIFIRYLNDIIGNLIKSEINQIFTNRDKKKMELI